jgi:hypothetical protein
VRRVVNLQPVDTVKLLRLLTELEREIGSFGEVPSSLSKSVSQSSEHALDAKALKSMLGNLARFIDAAQKSGELVNIWTVAGLGRDELRNVSVLSWLFDRNGSHGQGSIFLRAFLAVLKAQLPASFTVICDQDPYLVSVETHPLADKSTRVDIEIDACNFLIFIEAKIDAIEGIDQVPRLRNLVQQKAKSLRRTPIVIFLCVARNRPARAKKGLVIATWDHVAQSIETCLRQRAGGSSHLKQVFQQFGHHVRQF